MEKRGASLGQRYGVALWACFAFAWPCLAFSAALPDAPVATQKDEPADGKPDEVVEFLGNKSSEDKPEGKEGETDTAEKKGMFSSMRLAPILLRMGGSVGYSVVRQVSGSAKPSIQQVLSTSVDVYAISYIWQPWFAKVEGLMRYTNNLTVRSQGGAGGGVPNSNVYGNATLKVFPYSRFPLEMSISQNEAFTGYGTGAPNSQTNMLRIMQRYTPPNRLESYMASLTRTIAGGLNLAKDKEDGLDFEMSTSRFDKQSHSLSGASYRKIAPVGSVTLLNRLVSRHDYRPSSEFFLSGLGNMNFTNNSFQAISAKATSLQLSAFSSWMPKEEPYYLTSSLRGFGIVASSNGGSSKTRSVNANLGGVYTVNKYLRVDASANASVTESNGVRTQQTNLASSQAATVNYPLPSINFGKLSYSRGVNGSFVNRVNSGGVATQTLTVSPNHALSRGIDWMDGVLNLSVNQGLTVSKASRSGETASLAHQGRATWGRVEGKQISSVSLSVTDQRAVLGRKNFFQLFNLQAVLNTELDRNSAWTGNLTMQAARNGGEQLTSPFVSSSSASLGYTNRRMFNVNRLSFQSDFRMTSKSLLPVSVNTKDQGDLSWLNKFTYRIGRLQLAAQADVTHAQNQTNTLIMFSALRYFGAN